MCLVVASEREEFFMEQWSQWGVTREECGVATARLYGEVVEELEVPGEHLEVTSRCIAGDVDEFNTLLRRLLDAYLEEAMA